jgi:hypothetical protein
MSSCRLVRPVSVDMATKLPTTCGSRRPATASYTRVSSVPAGMAVSSARAQSR